jgi:hypothetical protein
MPIYLKVSWGEGEIHMPWRARKDHGMKAQVYLLQIHPVLEIPLLINPKNHHRMPREQGVDQADHENPPLSTRKAPTKMRGIIPVFI